MKKESLLPRWLTFDSIKKFFDPKQLFEFIIPTVGFYYGIIPKTIPKTEFSVIILLIFTFFLLINLRNKYIEYEKSIAEVLETGYFTNFFEIIAQHILEKKEANESIILTFKDKEVKEVKADQIKVKVILPSSKDSLRKTSDRVKIIAKPGTIDNGAWVLAKENPDESVTIYEYPRTLIAITRYLNPNIESSEEMSKIFHKHFIAKFNKDWDNAINKIPSDIFMKLDEIEE